MFRPNWIRRLLRLAAEGTRSSSRYIVRFPDRRTYSAFLKEAAKALVSARPLGSIRAVSCALPAEAGPLLRRVGISFEEDRKAASVHAVTLRSDAPVIPWGVSRINAPKAWTRSTGSRVKVAVIDTGIDFQHPDLKNAIAGGVNLVYRQMPPYDDNGHGTHIAGTIAAEAERSGVMGVAPGALIYAVKAFDYNGTAFVSDIVSGIDWCVRSGIDIINMSFGMKTRSLALEDAVRNAHRAGVIIIASSGNDGRTGIDYPARCPEVISVGATNRRRTLASFSNKSAGTDVYAPGDRILSTWPRGRYNELSGTSMATSHVSGVAALLLGLKPGLRAEELRSLLQRSTVPLKGEDLLTGHTGEIDALRAVRLTQGRAVGTGTSTALTSGKAKTSDGKRIAKIKRTAPPPRR